MFPRDDMVTASGLVRFFGRWRERALRRPVYVLHRGQPRLILASVELIEALCRRREDADVADDTRRLAALLDGSPDMIVVVGPSMQILAASRAVRTRFGERAAIGSPVAALVGVQAAPSLTDAIKRVAASAASETIDWRIADDLSVALTIEPHPDGVALFAHASADGGEDRGSFDRAFSASQNSAVARIDTDGRLDGPHSALAALTGIDDVPLAGLAFASLFAIDTRAEVLALLAAVAGDGQSRTGAARLLVHDGDPRQVSVAVASRRRGDDIGGAVALILATN